MMGKQMSVLDEGSSDAQHVGTHRTGDPLHLPLLPHKMLMMTAVLGKQMLFTQMMRQASTVVFNLIPTGANGFLFITECSGE